MSDLFTCDLTLRAKRDQIGSMSLNDHEKIGEIANQFAMLADLEEPEALIAVLARACRRKAHGAISPDLAKRWSIVATALMKAEIEVAAANSPDARKLDAHMAGQAPQQATVDALAEASRAKAPPEAPRDPPAAA